MADNRGFRVDKLGSIDLRTGAKVDHLVTALDYPWVAIWMSPRETIRKVISRDPTHQVLMLGALTGALAMLDFFLGAALGFNAAQPPAILVHNLPILTLASPFLGAALGLGMLYIGGFVIAWCGRALGGVGDGVMVRAALAWSSVPQICFSIAMLAIMLGSGVWQVVVPSLPDPNAGTAQAVPNAFTAIQGVESLISLWSFILMLHCVGEVHRFSAWRALGAVLLPVAGLMGIAVIAAVGMH